MMSIIITSHDEGDLLYKTLDSLCTNTNGQFQVVVIDDASSSPIYNHPNSTMVFHRNRIRRGLIYSRILGADYSVGTHLVFMDAHCKPERDWDVPLLEAFRQYGDRVIVSPAIPALNASIWKNNMNQKGVVMRFDGNLNMKWIDATDESLPYCESPIFAGSTFMISKSFYNELGGFDNGLEIWGGENIDLSVRCWLCGGRVLVAKSSYVGHLFKSSFTYAVPTGTINKNKLRVSYVNFSPDRFKRISTWLGLSQGHLQDAQFWDTADTRRLQLLRDRIFDDDWYFKKFNFDV